MQIDLYTYGNDEYVHHSTSQNIKHGDDKAKYNCVQRNLSNGQFKLLTETNNNQLVLGQPSSTKKTMRNLPINIFGCNFGAFFYDKEIEEYSLSLEKRRTSVYWI